MVILMNKEIKAPSNTHAIEILAKLRRKLIDNHGPDLAKESAELYNHIEKTLLSALREHYEHKEQSRAQV